MAKLTRKQSKYFNDILRRLKMAEDYLKDETRCGGTYHLPDSRLTGWSWEQLYYK